MRYKVVRGVLRAPRGAKAKGGYTKSTDYVKQGEIVPEGMLSEESLTFLLKTGRIERVGVEDVALATAKTSRRGKWGVDPTGLTGKGLEELLVMVLEIDPNFQVNTLKTEADAVRQLTLDWDPAFREDLAKATDRSKPEQLRSTGVKSAPLSESAERALANAKEKAQATE